MELGRQQDVEPVPPLAFEQLPAGCRTAGTRPCVRSGCCEQVTSLAAKAELICQHFGHKFELARHS